MLNVSSLIGVRTCPSDALRYGVARPGEHTPRTSGSRRPVVVWNCTRRCNLACAHCYASARATPAEDELSTQDALALLDDLAAFNVPALLFSGGEPLTRPGVFELLAHGRDRGLRCTISTNGLLIDPARAHDLAEIGVEYVGVSIDGHEGTHDRLRRQAGAWKGAVTGLRNLAGAGVPRGVRFTLTPATLGGLEAVLELVVRESIERLCVYHLVPVGRASRFDDISVTQRRAALVRLFEFAAQHPATDVLTVDNPSDGSWLVRWLAARDLEAARAARAALAWNRGARSGSGVGLACVDERGEVHPDQFSRHRGLGNVRERPFSEIWTDPTLPFLRKLRSPQRPVPAACAACPDLELCGGGFRTRAESATGDPWGFDPSCVLAGTRAR